MSKKIKINQQSDLNIGTAGHVDHGKCVAKDTSIPLPGKGVVKIDSLWELAENKGRLVKSSDNEWVYSLDNLIVYALDSYYWRIVESKAFLYVQDYSGQLYKVM